MQTLSAQFQKLLPINHIQSIQKMPTASAQLTIPPERLVNQLSYSAFKRLVEIDDITKRTFYEIEGPTVRVKFGGIPRYVIEQAADTTPSKSHLNPFYKKKTQDILLYYLRLGLKTFIV